MLRLLPRSRAASALTYEEPSRDIRMQGSPLGLEYWCDTSNGLTISTHFRGRAATYFPPTLYGKQHRDSVSLLPLTGPFLPELARMMGSIVDGN